MKSIFLLSPMLLLMACNESNHPAKSTQTDSMANTVDTAYHVSKEHQPYIVTGYFNPDNIPDTAIIVRHNSTGKDALFIKHGGTPMSFLLKNGEDVGSSVPDFNWVEQFELIKKGTKIWDNVIDGEIIGEDQVPENKKTILKTDGLLVHVNEASGGGIIYYNDGKYIWVQQD